MIRFLTLWNWTEQGIAKVEGTVERAEKFVQDADKSGVRVKEFLWLAGEYDGMILHEAADEATALATIAGLARRGNIRTRTLRAFDASEMRPLLAKLK